ERVLRRAPLRVVELVRELRILGGPGRDAGVGDLVRDLLPERLPVVAVAEEQVARAARARRAPGRQEVASPPADPGLEMLVFEVGERGFHGARLYTTTSSRATRPS